MPRPMAATLLFCFAGLLSSSIYGAYSIWVENLYNALPSQYAIRGKNPADSAAAYQNWYRQRTALGAYADRKWPLLCFGFPLSMTISLAIASRAGWLPRIEAGKSVLGLLPIYIAPWIILFLAAISWFLLLIPSLAVAAWVFAGCARFITSRKPVGLLRRLMMTGALCVGAYVLLMIAMQGDRSAESAAASAFLIGLETTWGGLFGAALAAASNSHAVTGH